MSRPAHERVEQIFHDALQHAPGPPRSAFLDGALAENPELRDRVEALLDAHEEAQSEFLQGSPLGEGPDPQLGSRIGPYKLLQEIGSGGMGVVYMAEQEQPVRRKVALKVIKLGMDTKQVVARFEAERQALALMDHAHIARVLDAGATDTGRPYFVMELVRGVPIGEYCETNKLGARQRIELFISVCRGIQHAHNKGVIHRDIKPGNVLVTLHDGEPVPKIIDFGVAKAMHQRLTEKTLFTEFKQFIGTPEYMSPEQAEMSGLDVDTRSDIYSLGVLLYELLTGTTPVDGTTLRTVGYGEMTRMIREEEPLAPSTQVSKLGQSGSLPKQLGADPGALARLFRGDLDWIVMRALEKDRTRRYETAAAFAEDLERHLSNRPVEAGPPGSVYRVRKFLRRNRRAVVLISGIGAALILGLIGTTAGFLRARAEAERSGRIADSLQELLSASDPVQTATLDLDVQELLERAKQLFGEDHATVAAVTGTLARQRKNAGDFEAAEALQRESLRIWKLIQGDENHINVALAMTALGDLLHSTGAAEESETLMRKALGSLESAVPGSILPCSTMETLAATLASRGEFAEAIDLLRRSIQLRRNAPGQEYPLQVALEQLVQYTLDHSDKEAALEALLELREVVTRMYEPDSYRVITSTFALGNFLYQTGQRERAEPYLREAVAKMRNHEGTSSSFYLVGLDGLFQLVQARPDPESQAEAAELLTEIIGVARHLWDSQRTAANLSALSNLYAGIGRRLDGLATLVETRKVLGDQATEAQVDRLRREILRASLNYSADGDHAGDRVQQALRYAKPWIERPTQRAEAVVRLALQLRTSDKAQQQAAFELLEQIDLPMEEWFVGMHGPVENALRGLVAAERGDTAAAATELGIVEAFLATRDDMKLTGLRGWHTELKTKLAAEPVSDD